MDCNKEEATRAKDIAEVKMQGKDFNGAKKLLLKALNLFPDIENASHMLTVCEVHCSAENLCNGQTDHYGILQVELSADDSLIRKQYRRLALLLHPDKNKFAGAEAAFKLVGEAYKVLSDQANRQVYDAKRRVQVRTVSTWQPSQNARNARRYTPATFNVLNNQFGGLKQQDQHPSFFSPNCFWTMCLFCKNRFQYSRTWINREVQCQRCFKKFLAFEVAPQNVPPPGSSSGFSWSRTGFHEAAMPSQHSYPPGSQTHASQPSKPVASSNNGYGSRNKEEGVEPCGDRPGCTQPEKEPVKKTGNARRMRNRRVVSSSDSSGNDSSDSDSILEVDPTVVHDSSSSRYPRRSNRHRTNVIYKEDESEDDSVRPRKRLRKAGSVSWKNQHNPSPEVVTNGVNIKRNETQISEDGEEGKQTDDGSFKDILQAGEAHARGMMSKSKAVDKKAKQVETSSSANSDVGSMSRKPQAGSSFSCPDPDFYNFDKDRDQSKFAVNQIWAVYDDVDGMPRYYALIQKVLTSGFRLQYIWLESNPTSTSEKVWVKAGLPIACGNFKLGSSCDSESQEMFSHVIFSEKSSGSKYNIYPKKGEIWALFKDWDIRWSSPAGRPEKYLYEYVEVVSDFAYGKDIAVSHLVKVNGFRYLFNRDLDKENTVMPSGHLLKFSHRIPYYKVCEEREGIPRDSFELDPAALPESLVKIIDSVSDHATEVLYTSGDPATGEDNIAGGNKDSRHSQNVFETGTGVVRGTVSGSSDDLLDKPEQAKEHQHMALEFCNFHELKSEEQFKQGQIWALYCDIDAYPKYYAWVKKVDWEVRNCISIKWLELQPTTSKEKLWSKNGLPFGCGRFKAVANTGIFDSIDPFSHIVRATTIKKNDLYEIYPNPGEIWAVYKNWNLKWTSEDIREVADFIMIEVIIRDERVIKAVSLTKVKGYNYVFMPETRGMANIEIPLDDCLIFSHQIPAFKLTTQESGKLKGYWELDPDSIPKNLSTMDH